MKKQTVEVGEQRLHQRMVAAESGIGAAVYSISARLNCCNVYRDEVVLMLGPFLLQVS